MVPAAGIEPTSISGRNGAPYPLDHTGIFHIVVDDIGASIYVPVSSKGILTNVSHMNIYMVANSIVYIPHHQHNR